MISSQIASLPVDLIAWRNRNGISLSSIAASTKVGSNYLEAIERGEFHRLPGGVYSLSYVRQYARAIGYDEDELVECCRRSLVSAESLPEAGPAPENRTSRILDRIRSLWASRTAVTFGGEGSPIRSASRNS